MPRLLLLLTLLLAVPTLARASTSADEVRFGIDVARRGLWREARFRFEKAVQQDPDNAAALNDLAIALEQEGEFDKAREAYARALRLRSEEHTSELQSRGHLVCRL